MQDTVLVSSAFPTTLRARILFLLQQSPYYKSVEGKERIQVALLWGQDPLFKERLEKVWGKGIKVLVHRGDSPELHFPQLLKGLYYRHIPLTKEGFPIPNVAEVRGAPRFFSSNPDLGVWTLPFGKFHAPGGKDLIDPKTQMTPWRPTTWIRVAQIKALPPWLLHDSSKVFLPLNKATRDYFPLSHKWVPLEPSKVKRQGGWVFKTKSGLTTGFTKEWIKSAPLEREWMSGEEILQHCPIEASFQISVAGWPFYLIPIKYLLWLASGGEYTGANAPKKKVYFPTKEAYTSYVPILKPTGWEVKEIEVPECPGHISEVNDHFGPLQGELQQALVKYLQSHEGQRRLYPTEEIDPEYDRPTFWPRGTWIPGSPVRPPTMQEKIEVEASTGEVKIKYGIVEGYPGSYCEEYTEDTKKVYGKWGTIMGSPTFLSTGNPRSLRQRIIQAGRMEDTDPTPGDWNLGLNSESRLQDVYPVLLAEEEPRDWEAPLPVRMRRVNDADLFALHWAQYDYMAQVALRVWNWIQKLIQVKEEMDRQWDILTLPLPKKGKTKKGYSHSQYDPEQYGPGTKRPKVRGPSQQEKLENFRVRVAEYEDVYRLALKDWTTNLRDNLSHRWQWLGEDLLQALEGAWLAIRGVQEKDLTGGSEATEAKDTVENELTFNPEEEMKITRGQKRAAELRQFLKKATIGTTDESEKQQRVQASLRSLSAQFLNRHKQMNWGGVKVTVKGRGFQEVFEPGELHGELQQLVLESHR